MRKKLIISMSFCFFIFSMILAKSMPILMDQYNDHPKSMAKYKDDCLVCHVREDGSGPLTGFGKKYDRTNLDITDKLVNQYPNLFSVDGKTQIQMSESSSPDVTVPGNEPFSVKKYYHEECKNCHGKYGEGDPFQGVTTWSTKKWMRERAPKYDELLNIILFGKDKMIGHTGKITENEAREILDLVILIAKKNA